ncbi:hypothetical protein THIOKS11230012 [Thiocapsa sp. KS1]|nr:hypothetical protein THIOKS11230012 [Thiocapsa sp. KS1]
MLCLFRGECKPRPDLLACSIYQHIQMFSPTCMPRRRMPDPVSRTPSPVRRLDADGTSRTS